MKKVFDLNAIVTCSCCKKQVKRGDTMIGTNKTVCKWCYEEKKRGNKNGKF